MDASPARTRIRLSVVEWPLLAATTLLAIGIFLHRQITSGFALLYGDHYDGFIEAAILQHWTNWLHGTQPWNITGYFYPFPDTLGYNDGYFLLGLIYALVRGLGADPLLASDVMHAAVKAFGCVGMYLLLRTLCRYRVGTSLLGALLFTISTNSIAQGMHGQLFTIAFVPIAALLLCRCARALFSGTTRDVMTWSATAARCTTQRGF